MTRARVSAETSVPPRSTLDTVGTLVPAVLATNDNVGRDPAGRGGMGDRLAQPADTSSGGRPGAGAGTGTYANQSKATVPSVAYMPMTRPVKPQATSVER